MATALIIANTKPMTKFDRCESTKNGTVKAPIRATLEAIECPVALNDVGNNSGVATHVAHDAAIIEDLAIIPNVVTPTFGMLKPMMKTQVPQSP